MKRAVTCFLTVFVITAIVTKIVLLNTPQEAPVIHDGNHIILCHAEVRCPACINMEFLIKKVLNKPEYADVGLILLEYDRPKNREFAERFHVGTLAIILLEQKNGKTIRSCDISTDARNLIRDGNKFVEMLEETLNGFYGHTRRQ